MSVISLLKRYLLSPCLGPGGNTSTTETSPALTEFGIGKGINEKNQTAMYDYTEEGQKHKAWRWYGFSGKESVWE